MSSFGANCPTGKDPRVPENQRGNLQGGCEPDSPGTELGAVRPKTRSQGDVGPSSEGATRSSRNQRESSWAEQPSGDLATRCSGEPQLLEATESPSLSQPPYFLRFHHFEPHIQSQEFPGPALRSTATMSHHVATPAPKAHSQAFLPVSGRQQTVYEFSFDSSSHFIPAGQGFHQQAPVQVPDLCAFFTLNPIGDIGGRVLRSHATASGHRSSASEVSPEVCPPPDSVVDSTTLGNLPDPMSPPATPRRGRNVSRSSRSQTATPRRGRSVSRPSRSQTQGNPSTSGTEFLKRALTSTSSSPPRRPVRMRASSPSPPGRLYPIYSQDNECSSSSSSDSSSDVSGPSSPYK